ncbi:carcinoembryonic antigen-related cell adhesion molecule 5-like [Cebidichthys violaceus]|uniref:carcinoembryonic antigen-related cell adhesion molecule 5-like n=1 Tax=Cebidichthys violaceus TaxID=271503 RepID=UPI0035CB88EB
MEIAVIHFIILVAISGLTKGAGVLPDSHLNKAVGETVMFSTTLTPSETPFQSVTWKFGGKDIIYFNVNNFTEPEYEGRITFFISTGSLELRNLAHNDSGEYNVSISIAGEPPKEGNTRLDVHVPVSDVMATASSTDLVEDSSVRLSCSSSGSSLSFLWLNGSSEVTASDRVQLTDGGANVTINVTRYDQGPFRCHVSNPVSDDTSGLINLFISYGPDNMNLKISPPQQYHEEGSNINLSCSADSRPDAQYTWLLNGDLLSDTGPEFRLMDIQESKSGNYSCRANNSKTLRSIKSLPAAISVLTGVANVMVTSNTTDVLEYSTVRLSCSSSGSFLSFLWLNGSSEITESDRVQLTDGGSTLTVVSVTRCDQGPFRCQVFNPVSNGTSGPVNLSINYGPENINLTISPSQKYFEEGSNMNLMCSADSRPVALFQWFLNGDLLSGTGPELSLMNIQMSLTKGAGVLPDGPLNAAVGETVMLSTMLTPSETPFQSVTWKFGGKNIYFNVNNFTEPEYEARITFFISTGSLELRNLTHNDSGEYSVFFSIAGEPPKEGNTRLDVHVPVSDVMATASSTDLVEDSSVRLTCSSSGSSLSCLWLNGSSEVTASDRVQLTDGGANVTINVTRYDQGPFRCNVSKPVNGAGSGLINLFISYGPDTINLTISLSQQYYDEGSDIILSCSADSRPVALFQWFLNGDLLSETGPELSLMNIQMSQSGNYSCQAFNNKTLRNEMSQPSVVSVLERISGAFIRSKTNPSIEGNSFNLSCDAAGSVFTRDWMKDGLHLTPDDTMALYDNNRVLSFNSLSKKDTGDYFCNVSNPLSHDDATYTMVVFYGPENVQICGPSEIHLEETLTLICFAESVPATYTWKLNGTKIHNSAIFTKNITESSDSGDYICEVMNSITGRTLSAVHGLSVTDRGSGGLSAGVIAGIVIVCLVASSAGAGGGYYLYKKKNKKTPPHSESKEPEECVYENTSIYENISNQRSSFP